MERSDEEFLISRGYRKMKSKPREIWKRSILNRMFTIVALDKFQSKVYQGPFYGRVDVYLGDPIAWKAGYHLRKIDNFLLKKGNSKLQ